MLLQEHLVSRRIVHPGVAPAIEQIAPFAATTTRMSGGLGRSCTVVDHPYLTIAAHA